MRGDGLIHLTGRDSSFTAMTMGNEINDQAEPDRRRPRSREGKTLIEALRVALARAVHA